MALLRGNARRRSRRLRRDPLFDHLGPESGNGIVNESEYIHHERNTTKIQQISS